MATDPQSIELACESCGARILIEPLMRTATCPYCDSPSVVDRPESPGRPDPVFAVGFAVAPMLGRGWRFALLRNLVCFLSSILIAVLTVATLGMIG